jgi:NAD+ diphosphatase
MALAAEREVLETVGVRPFNLRHLASQVWFFPHSLMLAFIADWVDGDIRIDALDIASAERSAVDNLPLLPSPAIIARRLIDSVAAEMSAAS